MQDTEPGSIQNEGQFPTETYYRLILYFRHEEENVEDGDGRCIILHFMQTAKMRGCITNRKGAHCHRPRSESGTGCSFARLH